tara:strand:- start:422 stop:1660 length:1239 start_codon:yes stop_codon:yes gene_type:complete
VDDDGVDVRYRVTCREAYHAFETHPIVAFFANPWFPPNSASEHHLVAIGGEMRTLMEAISPFDIRIVPGTTKRVFVKEMRRSNPVVVSISMHNMFDERSPDRYALAFESGGKEEEEVEPATAPPGRAGVALTRRVPRIGFLNPVTDLPLLLRKALDRPGTEPEGVALSARPAGPPNRLFILSVCCGGAVARHLFTEFRTSGACAVIFWNSVVLDNLAWRFAVAAQLAAVHFVSPVEAYSRARVALRTASLAVKHGVVDDTPQKRPPDGSDGAQTEWTGAITARDAKEIFRQACACLVDTKPGAKPSRFGDPLMYDRARRTHSNLPANPYIGEPLLLLSPAVRPGDDEPDSREGDACEVYRYDPAAGAEVRTVRVGSYGEYETVIANLRRKQRDDIDEDVRTATRQNALSSRQ